MIRILLTLILLSGLVACNAPPVEDAPPVQITIPAGATFQVVVDTLHSRGLVEKPRVFGAYARWKKADTKIRAGDYSIRPGTSWSGLLEILTTGRVVTETLTIPEGFRLTQIAPRVGEITGLAPESVLAVLLADSMDLRWGVPGPGLEGYLFPDSYWVARGAPLDSVLGAMIQRYRTFWTPERVARREALGMTEREVVTLASIVQAEARVEGEMPLIASVYHNRLAKGQLLQADPTVLYALGGHRERLLYAAMDSVADHPYNTYTQPGLPPGPIGAPGERALEATLNPAETDFYFFVAQIDGTHVFSGTLAEHNRNVARLRPEWERFRREQGQGQGRG